MQNKILTKEIVKRFQRYPIYSQDGKGLEAKVLLKVFNPYGVGTWVVLEAEEQGDDWYCFGVVDIGYGAEFGYFMLNELINFQHPKYSWAKLEREKYESDGKHLLKDVMPDLVA